MLFKDQTHRIIELDSFPKRIISVVPSQTELLYDLGLEKQVVGITKFCVHPKTWYQTKEKIGGTKNLNLKKIESLNPDLIIANKEENTKAEIEYLCTKYKVWISDITTLDDAIEMIDQLGAITNTTEQASEISNKIKAELQTNQINTTYSTLYFIWKNPYMVAGHNTFIHEMMRFAGFMNICTEERYPEISIEYMQKLNPSVLLLSSEPYPFREKHVQALQTELPQSYIKIVDGEMFSWYGSRMVHAFKYFSELKNEIKLATHA